jgi:peptide/nickel transport system permease protein
MAMTTIEAQSTDKPKRRRITLSGAIGFIIVGFWLAMAIIGPFVAPYSAGKVVDMEVFGLLTWKFPLGTDYLGRDMLSRVLYGTQYTVGLALAATALACSAGATLGLLAAVVGGWFDATLSRLLDALISIPSLLFGLVVVAVFGSSLIILVATAAVIYTPGAFRISRSLAVNTNAMDFVIVARARGEGTRYVMTEEVFPNIIGPVLADFGLRFVFVILLLSRLSFLGLGIQPPHADWGSLVRENISGLAFAAPAVVVPALAIASLTIGVNLIIDSLQLRRPNAMEAH